MLVRVVLAFRPASDHLQFSRRLQPATPYRHAKFSAASLAETFQNNFRRIAPANPMIPEPQSITLVGSGVVLVVLIMESLE
jgi:hypothetical protein